MSTNGGYDHYLGHDGGYCIPKESRIGREMRMKFSELLNWYGPQGLIPVYLENGVFNFYMKVDKTESIASAEAMPGFPRQERNP